MSWPRFAVTASPLDPAAVTSAATGSDASVGAVVTFAGLVRAQNAGRQVLYLEYEAYDALAVRAFELIETEAAAQWPSTRLAIHHRIGRLQIGELSVVIVSTAAHRAPAFEACRYAIERVKQIAPIWKHEHFEGGDVWIEGATARPEDETARAEALSRACR